MQKILGMYRQFRLQSIKPIIFSIFLLLFQLLFSAPVLAADDIKLVIDGGVINTSPRPLIENGRTLVPVRLISERLGAVVDWNEQNRIVHIVKGNRSVILRIDSRIVEYISGEKTVNLCDVPPKIINDRTFVPLRLVSNALGVTVNWEDSTRTVRVNSAQPAEISPFFDLRITSLKPGQAITGRTELQTVFPTSVPQGAAEIKYLLIRPETGKGIVIARGNNLTAKYSWLPDLKEQGHRIIVAALYDKNGHFLAGDAVPVVMAVVPNVVLTGLQEGQVVQDTVSLGASINFSASYIKYEIINQDKSKVFVTDEADPQGQYKWSPMMEDNGATTVKVIAFDHNGQGYPSKAVNIKVDAIRKLALMGVADNASIDKPVTLWASRNFQVSETEYVLKDFLTGNEEVLAKVGYASYQWFPGPERPAGTKILFVRVKDTAGRTHTSEGIVVKLTGTAKLLLEGVGPQQVVTGPVTLKAVSNVNLSGIQFYLVNPKTGAKRNIAGGMDPLLEYSWTPAQGDEGEWKIQAEATLPSGGKILSEGIPFKVYLGKLYTARPIVQKDSFLTLASGLAIQSWKNTGMSAALQTAQAILETGWGQSVPVDKYTGKFSNNLFGIKGKGSAGSVISNTWEEYNGNTFRIDAEFRAYKNVSEGWNDHKQLLLTASRYEPFRAVMHNSTQGAWALKRAGYATDSKYPLKLMDIIKNYNLHGLDEVSI